MLELAGLEMKENCQIEELTLGEKKLLLLIKLVADTSKQYIFQSLFQDMEENEVQSAVRLIVEMSTYRLKRKLKKVDVNAEHIIISVKEVGYSLKTDQE